jgi:hypothetical protein
VADVLLAVPDHPALVFAVSAPLLMVSAWAGAGVVTRLRGLGERTSEYFAIIVAANLTLLALVIGFTFSMAASRYDQRKNFEEEEANAIGTEYLRADLLPAADAARVRELLKAYADQRVLFYTIRDEQRLREVDARTARLQRELWSAILDAARAAPTPTTALAVSGMNDVLNTQGYSQAAWLNRIPPGAWLLMLAIAISGNVLIGYGARGAGPERRLFVILPVVVAISFFLIADIDSPRKGLILVHPVNLMSLADSLRAP